ncbi:hypothetical protein FHW58_001470 [Duganella sp. 1224]|uniref:hypothetical protein n=1 Tax=Duganella sp. 1224 TaxID=2587052 RepID=UPI0015CD9060|nr:hypothetical protein [Duganella sp. 1224]NYE60318.1 hypothetical protein [Duganella sp. 1224]
MNLPFFTARDPELLRSDTGRDPLGLLPVWSEFGRQLVPIIAGPVGKLDGVKAVLLIHYTYAALFDDAHEKIGFRGHFRLVEGLLESYLHARDQRHCFGERSFASRGEFSVGNKDASTAVNGLYQYYRGTCNRAGLLQDGVLAAEAHAIIAANWNATANAPLADELRACMVKNSQRRLHPQALLASVPALRQSLDQCIDSPALNQLLFERLFGKPSQSALARHCAQLRGGGVRSLVHRLRARLAQDSEDPAAELGRQLEQVELCEPFLVTVQDAFDYLRRSSELTLDAVADQLAAYAPVIAARARAFLKLKDVAKNPRSQQMLAVADAACGGVRAFLQAVLSHHTVVASERGRDPMVRSESAVILSLSGPERERDAILKRLADGYPWENGYYLATAGNLYQQAEESPRV